MAKRFAGTRLREQREHRGLSQKDLGLMIGTRGGTVSRWERGEVAPSSWHLAGLIDVLGVEDVRACFFEDEWRPSPGRSSVAA